VLKCYIFNLKFSLLCCCGKMHIVTNCRSKILWSNRNFNNSLQHVIRLVTGDKLQQSSREQIQKLIVPNDHPLIFLLEKAYQKLISQNARRSDHQYHLISPTVIKIGYDWSDSLLNGCLLHKCSTGISCLSRFKKGEAILFRLPPLLNDPLTNEPAIVSKRGGSTA